MNADVEESPDNNLSTNCETSCGLVNELCRLNDENVAILSDNIVALEEKLQKTTILDEFEAYKLYCEYAHAKGFSVRKGKQTYFVGTERKTRSKLFICSKEGKQNINKTRQGTYRRLDERTGCQARIWFTCDEHGQFKVTKWVKEHNHDMAHPEHSYLLRSARSIGPAKKNLIASHLNSGVRPIDSYNMMVEDCGGVENIGYTRTDLYNCAQLLKSSKIEAGDSQSVINYFKKRTNDEGLFYWDIQLDVHGRVANIFWRDNRARIDYDVFGDVVTFDTTYRTNKYRLICGPFVGVNHHRQNVMFGCGFLSDETISSFEWLFTTFLESMGGKQPKTFFTDQDAAMMNVVPRIFSNSRHRLCQWHISRNAPSHLATLGLDKGLLSMFYKCMNECASIVEFEETWSRMLNDYNVFGNSWLDHMYKLRSKWSIAFNTDTFSAGLKSTSRSESTNRALNGITKLTTSLYQFVMSFDKLVDRWRRNEGEEDHRCNQGMPTLMVRSSEILKHASKIYTQEIYKLFEKEFMDGVGASDLRNEFWYHGYMYSCQVQLQGRHKLVNVVFDINSMDIKCSCCKFETMGILCSHSLKVLSMKNIHMIPEKYILERWCKDVRGRINSSRDIRELRQDESEMVYSNRLMRLACELVMQSKSHVEARMIFECGINDIRVKMQNVFEKQDEIVDLADGGIEDKDDANNVVLDPILIKTKGVSKARIKSHWEKKRKQASKGNTRRQIKRKQPFGHGHAGNSTIQEGEVN